MRICEPYQSPKSMHATHTVRWSEISVTMGVCLIHIFMDLVEGQDLDRAWEGFDKDTKERVAGQL